MNLRVVISRADKIGDLILSLPAIAWFKKSTGAHITLHTSWYCRDIAEWARLNEIVDQILWQDPQSREFNHCSPQKFDLLLSLFHGPSVKSLVKRFDIEDSVGPRSKISALWTYKSSLRQRRSQVKKSEMAYNLDLVAFAIRRLGVAPAVFCGLAPLKIPEKWTEPFRDTTSTIICLANGGSALNWPVRDYLKWVEHHTDSQEKLGFLISGVDSEGRKQEVLEWKGYDPKRHHIIEHFNSIAALVGYIGSARYLVASSTGPLHIAHAAGLDVLGIYPRKRVESFARWRPHGYWHEGELKWLEIESPA